eukprot:TRINITY_DN873_c0_g1_i5.p1 TRINITY_DN873_c0_g1~~TRINITY_DN873_c0_g1_i5.p1  ORF type:complete len:111 (-),score=7.24 TRINITY_DN873_c0_g1_i5:404-736(-)
MFGMQMPKPAPRKKKSTKSQKKLERRQMLTYVPFRCAFKGCRNKEPELKSCSGCSCAFYCSKEHQASDWNRHRADCKYIQRLGKTGKSFELIGEPFSSAKELKKYPLGYE